MTGAQVWQAFQLPGNPPPAQGIFANQPAPYAGQASSMWRVCMNLLAAVILLAIIVYMVAGEESVFQHQYSYAPRAGSEASFVTDTFDVKAIPPTWKFQSHQSAQQLGLFQFGSD
jgi:hypothetical protein